MKEKGTRDLAWGRHQETTQDERVMVIALYDDAGMTWA